MAKTRIMRICELTRSEREEMEAKANFSVDQKRLFDLLSLDCFYDDGLMMALQMSRTRFYRVKAEVMEKFRRLLPQIRDTNL